MNDQKQAKLKQTHTCKIEGYGTFEIRDSGEAPIGIRHSFNSEGYADLKALFQPETGRWLPISYMRFLRA